MLRKDLELLVLLGRTHVDLYDQVISIYYLIVRNNRIFVKNRKLYLVEIFISSKRAFQ